MQEYDWESDDLAKIETKAPRNFKVKAGSKEIIRILTGCTPVYTHSWQGDQGFKSSGCSQAQSKKCPACERAATLPGHQRKLRFGMIVLHIAKRPNQGKLEYVLKALPWVVDENKRNRLMEIHGLTNNRLLKIDLQVGLNTSKEKAEQFQDLMIDRLDASILDKMSAKSKKFEKEVKAELKKVELLKKFYMPEYDDIAKWLDADEESGKFEPKDFEEDEEEDDEEEEGDEDEKEDEDEEDDTEDDEDAEEEEDEEEDEEDDEEEDDDEDEVDEEEEEEEEKPKKGKRGRPKGSSNKKKKVKSKGDDDDFDELWKGK